MAIFAIILLCANKQVIQNRIFSDREQSFKAINCVQIKDFYWKESFVLDPI